MRRFCLSNPALAGWLVALSLCIKLLVPAGYMPEQSAAGVALVICPGASAVAAAMPAMAGAHHNHGTHDHTQRPCPYADLTLPALTSVDALHLAPPPRFAATLHLRFATTRPRPIFGLRPPLRGPPLLA